MTSNYPHLREAQRVVWRPDCTLSAGARHVAAYLLNRMNENYEGAYPSIKRIVADTGMGRDSVIKYTEEIIEDGFLSRYPLPRRRGMYSYRITSMEDLVNKLDQTLEDWAKEHWSAKSTGRKDRPVEISDQSKSPTRTGRNPRPEPVGISDTERLSLKAPVKAQYSPQPTVADVTSSPPQLVTAETPLKNLEATGLGELQMQEPGVAVPDEGIPWVAPKDLPAGYAQSVWFNRRLGKLYLVQGELGLAFYRSLRDDGFSPTAIKAGLTAAGAKAAGVANGPKARGGALEGLVRQYVGYAQEREESSVRRSTGQQTAFPGRPRMFVP